MLHRTLTSYHNNDPWDDSEEHPDGPLWLVTLSELVDNLPHGVLLESISGKEEVHSRSLDNDALEGDITFCRSSSTGIEYTCYGIRGWRNGK